MQADAFQTTACWWLSLAVLVAVGLNKPRRYERRDDVQDREEHGQGGEPSSFHAKLM
jgi:hypothetical protein